jgi:predicted HicB family RNase H-like nuclease
MTVRKDGGKFQLRTTPLFHATVIREASRQEVSLNAFVNLKLT